MKSSFWKPLLRLILFAALNLLLLAADAAPPSFRITDLGAGRVSAINDLGQVAGQSLAGVPFIWSSKTGRVDLTTCLPDAATCFANPLPRDINNSGQVVGYSEGFTALRWARPNKMVVLPVLGQINVAHAINGSGVTVGASLGYASFPRYWDKNAHHDVDVSGPPIGGVDLPFSAPGNAPKGSANGINEAGVIVGGSASDGPARASLWRNYAFARDLGTLPGDITSEALAINDHDVVVGQSFEGEGFYRGFMWTAADGMVDINGGADGSSVAVAINNSNWIVGSFGPKAANSKGDRPVLWQPNGEMDDLNSSVDLSHSNFLSLSDALDINALGEIVGTGRGAR